MAVNRVEINIKRVERHVTFNEWGVPHDELQTALEDARAEYQQLTGGSGTSVPAGAIRAVPANGEIVVIFSIETSK